MDFTDLIDGYDAVPLLYLVGSFTSIPESKKNEKFKEASDIALEAWYKGWSVISPHKNCYGFNPDDNMDYETWLIALASQIGRCDVVLVLPDWEESEGVKMEIQFARYLNIPVVYYDTDGVVNPNDILHKYMSRRRL